MSFRELYTGEEVIPVGPKGDGGDQYTITIKKFLSSTDEDEAERKLIKPHIEFVDGKSISTTEADNVSYRRVRLSKAITAWNLDGACGATYAIRRNPVNPPSLEACASHGEAEPWPIDEPHIDALPDVVRDLVYARVRDLNKARSPKELQDFFREAAGGDSAGASRA